MQYEFTVDNTYVRRVIFHQTGEDIFYVSFSAHDASRAECVFRKIESYRMAAECDGCFSGCFSMSQEGNELTFVGNISNLVLLLKPRAILPQSFFTQISQHAEIPRWLEASKKCQDQTKALIAMIIEKTITAGESLSDDNARTVYLTGLQERLSVLSTQLKESSLGKHNLAPSGLFTRGMS